MRDGWVQKRFDEICVLQRGFDLPTHSRKEGIYPLVSSNGITDRIDLWKVKGPGVITGRSGTIGNVHFIEEDYWPLNTALYIKEFHGNYERFIYYFLKQFDLSKYSSGTGVPTLNRNHVHSEIVSIPSSIEEQKKIVSILDETFIALDQAKANLEQNLQNAKELFQSELNSIFSNKGDDWVDKKLGDLCSLITDGKHGDCINQEESGYYFLSAKDIKNETLNYENARQITKDGFEETHRRTDLRPGDICMVNTGATIGKIALAPDNPKTYRTTFQKSVAIIKPISSILDNNFCCYLLKADLKKLVKVSSGSAVKNLLIGDLKNHFVSIPKSLEEQHRIVAQLDNLSTETKKLEALYQQKLNNLEELRKSVLQKAFSGELSDIKRIGAAA